MSTKDDKEYHREKVAEFKARHKKAGLCIYCKNEVVKGRKQCQYHLDYAKFYKKFRGKKNENV